MESLFRNIADLLQVIEAASDHTACPASFAERLQAYEPSLLLLADADGKVVAADDFASGISPDLVEALALDLGKCLDNNNNDPCTLEVPTDAGPQLACAVRISDGLKHQVFGCLVPRCRLPGKDLDETPAGLVVCGAFAWAAMRNKEDNVKLHRRIQHLLAELDTLEASRAEAITAVVEERQQRLHQQEENALLEELVQAAEAANHAKSQFLANAGHELRTPLTAILGFADLLADSRLSEEQRKRHLETICQNGRVLLELINRILDLSKIEAGKMTVAPIDCSPWHIIEDLASLMQVQAADKGLSLEVDYIFPVPEKIRTDPVRLRQILTNLIGNAIKFTEQGGVEIEVSCTRPPGASPRLQIAVADTGIGMDRKVISRLFNPFMQADTSATRRFGGTGLGLAISNRLAKMLGGNIQVESELGKGSTFTLSIDPGPLQDVPMIQVPPTATSVSMPAATTS